MSGLPSSPARLRHCRITGQEPARYPATSRIGRAATGPQACCASQWSTTRRRSLTLKNLSFGAQTSGGSGSPLRRPPVRRSSRRRSASRRSVNAAVPLSGCSRPRARATAPSASSWGILEVLGDVVEEDPTPVVLQHLGIPLAARGGLARAALAAERGHRLRPSAVRADGSVCVLRRRAWTRPIRQRRVRRRQRRGRPSDRVHEREHLVRGLFAVVPGHGPPPGTQRRPTAVAPDAAGFIDQIARLIAHVGSAPVLRASDTSPGSVAARRRTLRVLSHTARPFRAPECEISEAPARCSPAVMARRFPDRAAGGRRIGRRGPGPGRPRSSRRAAPRSTTLSPGRGRYPRPARSASARNGRRCGARPAVGRRDRRRSLPATSDCHRAGLGSSRGRHGGSAGRRYPPARSRAAAA